MRRMEQEGGGVQVEKNGWIWKERKTSTLHRACDGSVLMQGGGGGVMFFF